jgi:hypothetical protein
LGAIVAIASKKLIRQRRDELAKINLAVAHTEAAMKEMKLIAERARENGEDQ